MTIGTDYATPVTVNGFLCRNCADVANAKKHIDPQHPKSGPYGIDAKDDPTVTKTAATAAVTFGWALSGLNARQNLTNVSTDGGLSSAEGASGPQTGPRSGAQVDVSA
jgi:hypothetical protein